MITFGVIVLPRSSYCDLLIAIDGQVVVVIRDLGLGA